jgi:tRNA modification GTPase
MWSADELIVAAATVPGAGGRAIVRIAGHGLDAVLRQMFEASAAGFPAPGERPRAVSVRFAADGLRRDWGPLELTVLAWPGPAGPIGGPLAEVQLPSSAPLVDAVVAEACCHGARLARGGEFTLRAFLTGRLDLVQAEAVLGVVEARTPDELTAALDRLAGGAGRSLAGVRSDLLDLLADIEASIDFADETAPDSVPVAVAWSEVLRRLDGCHAEIGEASRRLAMRTTAANDLPRLVLVGRPNIGKSSLLNCLAGHEAALVADESGTTRDWIEIRLPVAGAREVVLVDLAGVWGEAGETARGGAAGPGLPTDAGDDEIGRLAQQRAATEIARADVLIACRDAAELALPLIQAGGAPRIDVLTRSDRVAMPPCAGVIATSSRTGAGIAELRRAIEAAVATLPPRGPAATVRMAVGCDAAARAVAEARREVLAAISGAAVDEALVAEGIRGAVESLAEITGAAIGGDLLDRIFSRHCIGK